MASPLSDIAELRLRVADQSFPLTAARMTIGRSRSCDIRIKEDSVSRLHAAIYRQDTALILEDMGSSNGTWLNDERVMGPRIVAAGDLLRFGTLGALIEDPRTPVPDASEQLARAAVDYTRGIIPGAPAGFGWRMLGLLLDAVLFGLGSLVPFAPLAAVTFAQRRLLQPGTLPPSPETMGIILGGCSALWLLYAWYYMIHGWARRGGTPGLRLAGLRLIDWHQRTPIGYPRALLRLASASVTCATLGAGFLLPLFRRDRKTLHDLLAGTLVIRRSPMLGPPTQGR